MRRSVAYLALVTALAACGGEPTKPPVPVATVSIAPSDPSLAVGASVALSATAKDAAGAVLTGRTVAWTSTRAEVATVDPTSGLVRAVGPGVAIIKATVEQKFAQVLITVVAPVATMQVAGRRATVATGRTLQLAATARDAAGLTLLGRAVTWSSSDQARATVSETGLVTGVAPGPVTITATSEGVAGAIALTVADLQPPEITGISPATLGPGITATITGANFDANPADLDVTVSGVPATVTAATPSQLTVQIPGFVPCQPTQNTPVSVAGAGGTAVRAHPIQVARARTVAVGEMLVLGGTDARCNELPAGGRYVLSVVNTSRAPGGAAGYEFRGQGGTTAPPASSTAPSGSFAAPLTWSSVGGSIASDVSPLRRAGIALYAAQHRARLDRERELARQLGSPRRAARAARARGISASGASLSAASGVPLDVGATTTLKIRTSDVNCTASKDVPARVVYSGTRSVILESTDAPLATTMDADYVALGTEFDTKMFDVLTTYFGNPLAYDASTDNNGRIVMLFTKAVNDRAANLLGFVTVCDFFPPSTPGASASNLAEIFYARVPTSSEVKYSDINTRVGWMHIMRGTLIHEAKHLVSYAERFATPEEAELEESWLEEATAQAAIEFYGRSAYYGSRAAWKSNATYRNTMYCDIRPTDAECAGQPSLISDHFLFLFGYFEGIESRSYFSSARDDNTVYGSGWLLTRWAADQFATDEAAFYKALTQSWQLTGLRNIEARTGQDFTSFHPSFMMALYADDAPSFTPPAGARYTVPSWNLRDMFLGISQDFTRNGQPVAAFPLRVRSVPVGSFVADVGALFGGSASYVELSGIPTAPQILDLRGLNNTALPADTPLRLAILRVE